MPPPLVDLALDPGPVTSEFTTPSAKKPKRTLGLAVGLSNLAAGGSVMVETVKGGGGGV